MFCLFQVDLSSSDSDDDLVSPPYASFLSSNQKPLYSEVAKRQLVITNGVSAIKFGEKVL